jgi:hypothetical protein
MNIFPFECDRQQRGVVIPSPEIGYADVESMIESGRISEQGCPNKKVLGKAVDDTITEIRLAEPHHF